MPRLGQISEISKLEYHNHDATKTIVRYFKRRTWFSRTRCINRGNQVNMEGTSNPGTY